MQLPRRRNRDQRQFGRKLLYRLVKVGLPGGSQLNQEAGEKRGETLMASTWKSTWLEAFTVTSDARGWLPWQTVSQGVVVREFGDDAHSERRKETRLWWIPPVAVLRTPFLTGLPDWTRKLENMPFLLLFSYLLDSSLWRSSLVWLPELPCRTARQPHGFGSPKGQ